MGRGLLPTHLTGCRGPAQQGCGGRGSGPDKRGELGERAAHGAPSADAAARGGGCLEGGHLEGGRDGLQGTVSPDGAGIMFGVFLNPPWKPDKATRIVRDGGYFQ